MVSMVLFSCGSNEDKLLSKLESHLKSNLKDPSSYELIESKLDTSFVIDNLKHSLDYWKKEVINNEKSIKDYDNEFKKLDLVVMGESEFVSILKDSQKEVDSLNVLISKTDPKKIQLIGGVFKYRAKNGFGALGIENSTVWYSPEKDKITTIN
jgi:hypothetical protein